MRAAQSRHGILIRLPFRTADWFGPVFPCLHLKMSGRKLSKWFVDMLTSHLITLPTRTVNRFDPEPIGPKSVPIKNKEGINGV